MNHESGIMNQESLEVQNQNLNSRFIIPDSFTIHNSIFIIQDSNEYLIENLDLI